MTASNPDVGVSSMSSSSLNDQDSTSSPAAQLDESSSPAPEQGHMNASSKRAHIQDPGNMDAPPAKISKRASLASGSKSKPIFTAPPGYASDSALDAAKFVDLQQDLYGRLRTELHQPTASDSSVATHVPPQSTEIAHLSQPRNPGGKRVRPMPPNSGPVDSSRTPSLVGTEQTGLPSLASQQIDHGSRPPANSLHKPTLPPSQRFLTSLSSNFGSYPQANASVHNPHPTSEPTSGLHAPVPMPHQTSGLRNSSMYRSTHARLSQEIMVALQQHKVIQNEQLTNLQLKLNELDKSLTAKHADAKKRNAELHKANINALLGQLNISFGATDAKQHETQLRCDKLEEAVKLTMTENKELKDQCKDLQQKYEASKRSNLKFQDKCFALCQQTLAAVLQERFDIFAQLAAFSRKYSSERVEDSSRRVGPETQIATSEAAMPDIQATTGCLEKGGRHVDLPTGPHRERGHVCKQDCDQLNRQYDNLSARLDDYITRSDDHESRLDEIEMIVGRLGAKVVIMRQDVNEFKGDVDGLRKNE